MPSLERGTSIGSLLLTEMWVRATTIWLEATVMIPCGRASVTT